MFNITFIIYHIYTKPHLGLILHVARRLQLQLHDHHFDNCGPVTRDHNSTSKLYVKMSNTVETAVYGVQMLGTSMNLVLVVVVSIRTSL